MLHLWPNRLLIHIFLKHALVAAQCFFMVGDRMKSMSIHHGIDKEAISWFTGLAASPADVLIPSLMLMGAYTFFCSLLHNNLSCRLWLASMDCCWSSLRLFSSQIWIFVFWITFSSIISWHFVDICFSNISSIQFHQNNSILI